MGHEPHIRCKMPSPPQGIKALARMATCSNCKNPISETDDRCSKCGADAGFPNVRAAAAELPDLNKRYEAAVASAGKQGKHDALNKFEESMKTTSAVISVKLGF